MIPDNQKIQQDIFYSREHTLRANDGDKVVAKITSYGGKNKNPEEEYRKFWELRSPGHRYAFHCEHMNCQWIFR